MPFCDGLKERWAMALWLSFHPWHSADLIQTEYQQQTLLCLGPIEISLLSLFFLVEGNCVYCATWLTNKSHHSPQLPKSGLFVHECCLSFNSLAPAGFFCCLSSLKPLIHKPLHTFSFILFNFIGDLRGSKISIFKCHHSLKRQIKTRLYGWVKCFLLFILLSDFWLIQFTRLSSIS